VCWGVIWCVAVCFMRVAAWELIAFANSGSVRGYSCVAVRCSVLQCVSEWCSVLQCVLECCSVL